MLYSFVVHQIFLMFKFMDLISCMFLLSVTSSNFVLQPPTQLSALLYDILKANLMLSLIEEVSKAFAVRAKYRTISSGPDHTLYAAQ